MPVPLYTNSYKKISRRPLFRKTRLIKFLKTIKSNYYHIVPAIELILEHLKEQKKFIVILTISLITSMILFIIKRLTTMFKQLIVLITLLLTTYHQRIQHAAVVARPRLTKNLLFSLHDNNLRILYLPYLKEFYTNS